MRIGATWLAIAALALPAVAAAHTRSQSYSSWQVRGDTLDAVFQVDARRVTQLDEDATWDALPSLLARHLGETVRVSQDGHACAAAPPRPLAAARGDLRVELEWTCPRPLGDVPATVVVDAFFEVSPSHVHYARVAGDDGDAIEHLVTASSHTFAVGGRGVESPTDFAAFFRLGLEHVLSGIDHLAFVVALVLLAGGWGRAAWAATGFTVGHSLTLALVATGWLAPDERAIEALIGFTVACAAAEALVLRTGPPGRGTWIGVTLVAAVPLIAKLSGHSALPWLVAAGLVAFAACGWALGAGTSRRWAPLLAGVFGLAHGAGFAGALLALEIPRERLLTALVAFNLGVEAAQLVVLAVLAAIAWVGLRLPATARRHAVDATACALVALGVYWYLARALSLA